MLPVIVMSTLLVPPSLTLAIIEVEPAKTLKPRDLLGPIIVATSINNVTEKHATEVPPVPWREVYTKERVSLEIETEGVVRFANNAKGDKICNIWIISFHQRLLDSLELAFGREVLVRPFRYRGKCIPHKGLCTNTLGSVLANESDLAFHYQLYSMEAPARMGVAFAWPVRAVRVCLIARRDRLADTGTDIFVRRRGAVAMYCGIVAACAAVLLLLLPLPSENQRARQWRDGFCNVVALWLPATLANAGEPPEMTEEKNCSSGTIVTLWAAVLFVGAAAGLLCLNIWVAQIASDIAASSDTPLTLENLAGNLLDLRLVLTHDQSMARWLGKMHYKTPFPWLYNKSEVAYNNMEI